MAKQIRYSDEFRKNSVKTYLSGNLSAVQLSQKLGVHRHTLCRWIKLYRQNSLDESCGDNNQLNALSHIHSINMHIAELEKLLLLQEDFIKSTR